MRNTLVIHDWDKWQSYRGDRGTPPWIKVHRNLMTSAKWAYLTDAEKGQLVSMWIVAAEKNGELPRCAKILKKICLLDVEPNISKFIELGFMTPSCQPDGASLTPSCQPDDAPETETETETEEITTLSSNSARPCASVSKIPFKEVIDYLNEKSHSSFSATSKQTKGFISARFKEGFSLDDFRLVIDSKCDEWLTDEKMIRFLRPQTLFATKFESYVQEAKRAAQGVQKGSWEHRK